MAAPIIVRPVIRLPDKKKDRDWAAFIISIVSFGIAVTSFFFSTLLEADDVRLVINGTPTVEVDGDGSLAISGGVKLSLINSGNRSESILSLFSTARRISKDEPKADCGPEDDLNFLVFNFGIEPFVLAPGKIENIISKKLSGFGIKSGKEKDTYFIAKQDYTPKNGDAFLVCIRATVVTPDSVITGWQEPVLRYEITQPPDQKGDVPKALWRPLDVFEKKLFDKTKPIVVVNERRWFGKIYTIFMSQRL